MNVDEFLARATQEEDGYDEEELEMVQRFQTRVSLLKQNLSQLQVYRVGNINIDAYIVGMTTTGDGTGLSTKLVET